MAFKRTEKVEITKSSGGISLPSEIAEVTVTYAVKILTVTETGVVASVHRSFDDGYTWGIYKDVPLPSVVTLEEAESLISNFM